MTSRRFLFVVLLVALVTVALVAGHASNPVPPASPSARTSPAAAALTGANPVWFCPGLPPSVRQSEGRVVFSNVGDAPAEVVVTDLADHGGSARFTFSIPARSVVARSRDTLGGPGALTVETFGGRVVVEDGVEGPFALDSTPCATEAAGHWYFAAGSTLRGVQQWLVIDNPYASDAKVDVTLRTNTGVNKPGPLQSLDVARRSRTVIALHDLAVRQSAVAVEVDTEYGSVVAGQTLVYTTDAGTRGSRSTIGSPVAGTDWSFAGGVVEAGSVALVGIANVGTDSAQIDVQPQPERPKSAIPTTSLTLAQDAVVWVQLGGCSAATVRVCANIPAGTRYSLDVRSEQDVAIVAQTLTRYGQASAAIGVASTPGEMVAARSWAFARSRVNGERATNLSFFNPTAVAAVVRVGLVHAGGVDRPAALQHLTVPAGREVTVTVVGGPKAPKNDAALTVDATGPVDVSRTIVAADEISTSVGVVMG